VCTINYDIRDVKQRLVVTIGWILSNGPDVASFCGSHPLVPLNRVLGCVGTSFLACPPGCFLFRGWLSDCSVLCLEVILNSESESSICNIFWPREGYSRVATFFGQGIMAFMTIFRQRGYAVITWE